MIKKLAAALLFLVSCFLFTVPPALAQSTPITCSIPRWTDRWTKVAVLPRPEHTFKVTVPVPSGVSGIRLDSSVDPRLRFVINEDFSKLSAIFAASNSNFLESEFQDQAHKQQNVTGLNAQDFNSYNGPGQKAAPRFMTDDLRIKYVDYVSRNSALKEASDTFTDTDGNSPRTIAVLVSTFGTPNPPSHGGDQAIWQTTWAPYWNKIPTAVNEFFVGFVNWGVAVGEAEWQGAVSGGLCNYGPFKQYFFTMPDYFRAASVSNQINQIMVPKAAQSSESNFVTDSLNNPTPLASIVENTKTAMKKLHDSAFITAIKKILKISFHILNPSKNAYAQDPETLGPPPNESVCPAPIPVLPNEKEGVGPFCGFQAEFIQYRDQTNEITPPYRNLRPEIGESCPDGIHCTFIIDNYDSGPISVPDNPRWDGGSCTPTSTGWSCTTTIRLYPVYFFPWLAPVWNNSTYSDTADNIAIMGIDSTRQQTGRPGLGGFFTPKGVEGSIFSTGKNLPSQLENTDGPKQRFFGAVDNLKSFVRDRALKPCELQRYLGVTNACL